MQTQVKVQMDERDAHGQPPPNPLQAPGQQLMGQSAYAQVCTVETSDFETQEKARASAGHAWLIA